MIPIDRRAFLKMAGFGAGSLFLGPTLSRLAAEETGFAAGMPRRLVVVMEGGGFVPGCTTPTGFRPSRRHHGLVDQPLSNYPLPPMLAPLEEHRDRISIIEGLSNRCTDTGHAANYGALGCYRANSSPISVGTPKGPTIDVEIGRHLEAIFPQLLLGFVDGPGHNAVYNCSALGRDKPLPTICKPGFAYNQLFGTVADGQAATQFQAQQNLLDFMIRDVKRARARYGPAMTGKLDPYLHAYEQLRHRNERIEQVSDHLSQYVPPTDNRYNSDDYVDRFDAHFELAGAALVSGLTHVVTLTAACGYPWFAVQYPRFDMHINRHQVGHEHGAAGVSARAMQTRLRQWHMALIARLMNKLQAVPEGDGTMLDNTLIIYMNEAGEAHHATCKDWPIIAIGNWGGSLKLGNRFLRYPAYGNPGHRTVANFYLSLLDRLGDHRETFGHPDGELADLDLRGPLPEILA